MITSVHPGMKSHVTTPGAGLPPPQLVAAFKQRFVLPDGGFRRELFGNRVDASGLPKGSELAARIPKNDPEGLVSVYAISLLGQKLYAVHLGGDGYNHVSAFYDSAGRKVPVPRELLDQLAFDA